MKIFINQICGNYLLAHLTRFSRQVFKRITNKISDSDKYLLLKHRFYSFGVDCKKPRNIHRTLAVDNRAWYLPSIHSNSRKQSNSFQNFSVYSQDCRFSSSLHMIPMNSQLLCDTMKHHISCLLSSCFWTYPLRYFLNIFEDNALNYFNQDRFIPYGFCFGLIHNFR